MARIIKIDPESELKVTHKVCGAEIGYFQNEIAKGIYHDYGGDSEIWYYLICPHCGEKVEVKKKW